MYCLKNKTQEEKKSAEDWSENIAAPMSSPRGEGARVFEGGCGETVRFHSESPHISQLR